MPANAIFLSIRPKYADRILDGTKTVELRRVRPRHITKGALVLVYVSSPIKSLVGAFKVDQVVEKPLQDLWKLVSGRAAVTREEFDGYFEGVSTGVGIFFSEVWRLPRPIELRDLREMQGFRPPQGFRYATASELASPQIAELMEGTDAVVQTTYLDQEG